ncbi:hypothetical protein A3D81_01435 [Candidatus Curtissbacteria bacterium RIFCSPHIGHO2_02_FULL_40_17]|uniref:DUF5671 domain-containing protein n=2 Tax=Candidatus Curtissiibacteriota TaxID=1752717 RepID=A0A1F5GII0_9BACT|nr:MAG: hypothetical protein A3D81_01435 [Candidatus Curtissbacteria bacterium RIFCSPHIGHO2_02_FULL_40_17]OGE04964.1 MAG: hypothetical protein A3F45_02420 [Candidatus Curtissbacteria bacterium RIFCSPHIGHO2_12_FULL_41_17]
MNEEVTNFIRQALASGTNPDVIRNQLLAAGWQENVISGAFASLNGNTKTSFLTKKKTLIIIPIILLVLIAVSGSVYLFLVKEDSKSADTEKSITNEKPQSPQASASAQLKTYMGNVHKFSFKYPADLT